MCFIITPVAILAQDNIVSDKYLVIDDINSFFENSDGLMIADCFQLYNIYEDESSKPIFIAVTDLSEVIKFSIESSSSTHENQRRCRLVISSNNWESAFYRSVVAMGVKFILVNRIFVSVEEFFKILK